MGDPQETFKAGLGGLLDYSLDFLFLEGEHIEEDFCQESDALPDGKERFTVFGICIGTFRVCLRFDYFCRNDWSFRSNALLGGEVGALAGPRWVAALT